MRVAVLGGGLQGACVAMELASKGIGVDLYDRNDRCLSQASAQNEGKIHLGYVYANDRSLRTARTMVRGAIAFASLMRRWIGDAIDQVPVSTPFNYVVHANSLLGIDQVEHHLRGAHAVALEESSDTTVDYFGADYRVPPARLSESDCGALFDRRTIVAAYRTSEVSIDPEALAVLVRERLAADPLIHCHMRAHVRGVALNGKRVAVDVEKSGEMIREHYDHVVNALWDGRLAVDQTAGLHPDRSWLYRVKYDVRMRAPSVAPALPSTTIVLGAFGDVVAYQGGNLYLSWYPAGMRGSSLDLVPPAWPLVLDGPASLAMQDQILDGLRQIVPDVGRLTGETITCRQVNAGIIFAWGRTDIQDPTSGLHERHAIGPQSRGRYHTVDTGKLTMAPFFGKMVADRILQLS